MSKLEEYNKRDCEMALSFMEGWYGKILALRNEANELIEYHVPQVYKDGDYRIIPAKVYDAVVDILKILAKLEGSEDFGEAIPTYAGPFGVLVIKRAEEEA